MCVCLLFVSRCMRPEGPWQRLAAALAGSSDYHPLLHDRLPSPTTMGYTGASLSPTTLSRLTKERKKKKGRWKDDEGKRQRKVQPRAGPARPPRHPARHPPLDPHPHPLKPSWTTPCSLPLCPPRTESPPLWPPPSTTIATPAPSGAPSGTPFRSSSTSLGSAATMPGGG